VNTTGFVFNLNSHRPDTLRAFYRDVIGLKPNPDMGEGALMAATTPFLIDGHSDVNGLSKEPARTITNFLVDDVDKEQARLEAAGVRFLGTPSAQQISFSTFVDPDGNFGQIFSMSGTPSGTEMFAIARPSGDPDRLRAFYRDVVGLSEGPPDLGNPLAAGGASIYIAPHSEVQGPAKEPARVMLNLFVNDLASEQKRIEGHGVKFLRSAGREYWGGVISTFVDPDGSYAQLIEFRPQEAQQEGAA
jgi:predicted enzyme related to lactoylglutathione lyase